MGFARIPKVPIANNFHALVYDDTEAKGGRTTGASSRVTDDDCHKQAEAEDSITSKVWCGSSHHQITFMTVLSVKASHTVTDRSSTGKAIAIVAHWHDPVASQQALLIYFPDSIEYRIQSY
jgi:hypothetical protein